MTILKETAKAIVAAAMAIFAAHCSTDCKTFTGPSWSDTRPDYEREIQNCAANAKSYEESCMCRKYIDEKYDVCSRFPDEASCKKVCCRPRPEVE